MDATTQEHREGNPPLMNSGVLDVHGNNMVIIHVLAINLTRLVRKSSIKPRFRLSI